MPLTSMQKLAMDPYSDDVLGDPTEFHRRLRDAGPAARVEQSEGFDLVAVGRYRNVREILQNPAMYINGRGGGILDLAKVENFREPAALQEADPPSHTGTRDVMTDVISPRTVRALRGQFQEAAERLVDGLLERGSFDAQTDVAEAFPLGVIPDAVMGAPEEGRENLLKYSTFAFEMMGPKTPRVDRVLAELGDVMSISEWITRSCSKEQVSPESFGARIWQAAADGRITDQQAANMVRSLLGAGIDTTIHSLGNAIFLLATNPQQWQKLHEQPTRAKFAYDEALRMHSPVRQIFRTPVEDTDIEGLSVTEGQKIMLILQAANRDPDQWGPNADDYDIDRDAAGHASLGRGIHGCVGAPIARLEADALLGAMARRIKLIELDGEPQRLINNSLWGFDRLPVRVVPA